MATTVSTKNHHFLRSNHIELQPHWFVGVTIPDLLASEFI